MKIFLNGLCGLLCLAFAGCTKDNIIRCSADETALHEAVEKSRIPGAPKKIEINAGTIYLTRPIALDSRDNGLVISGNNTAISGGVKLDFKAVPGKEYWSAKLPVNAAFPQWLWVNGSGLREIARFPENGYLTHLTDTNLIWLGTQYGGWNRPPTEYEMTHMTVKTSDLPDFDINDAELWLIHQWSSSWHRVKNFDRKTGKMVTAPGQKYPPNWQYPPGAFGKHEYFLRNVSCGLLPGRWLYHRAGNEIWYKPMPGEKLAGFEAEAANVINLLQVSGGSDIVVKNLEFRCANSVKKEDAAILLTESKIRLENLFIHEMSGMGVAVINCRDSSILNCKASHFGDSGIRGRAKNSVVADCEVSHCGNRGVSLSGDKIKILRNKISDCVYCGVICGGDRNEIRDNKISRVMTGLVDGAGIYGEMTNSVVSGNHISGIPQNHLRHGIYFDERSYDSVAENNVVMGHFPVMVHKSEKIIYRNNIFSNPEGTLKVDLVTADKVTLASNRFTAKKIFLSAPADALILTGKNEFNGEVAKYVKPRLFSFSYDEKGVLHCHVGAGEKKVVRKDWRKIVFLGDSITAAGIFVDELQLYLSCKYPDKEIEVINAGVPGDTASGGFRRLKKDVLAHKPDMVVVAFGMNDVGRNLYAGKEPVDEIQKKQRENAAASYRDNMAKIIDALQQAKIDVVLLAPFPYDEYGTRPGADKKYAFCNSVGLENLAWHIYTTYGNKFPIPAVRTALCRLYAFYPERLTAKDRVHPDRFGHWITANEIVRTLFDREKSANSLPFPLTDEMVEFGKIPNKCGIYAELFPMKYLGAGGEVGGKTQILREKMQKWSAELGKLREIRYFDLIIEGKGLSPENIEKADPVMRDFAKRWNLVERYEKYRALRKKLPEIKSAAEKARSEYFKTLRDLQEK